MRVPLDGQNWVEIKPVSELTRADRMAVNEVIVYEKSEDNLILRASADDKAAGAVMARVITDWSFPMGVPSVDPSSLDRLSLEQDDALRAAVEEHLKAIQGKNAPAPGNEVPTPA
jgi:hypothetical protein